MTLTPGQKPQMTSGPHAVPLSDSIQGALSFESYGNTRGIEGVCLTPLRKHRAENGWFSELFRVADGVVEGTQGGLAIRQLSAAHAAPHRVNAFHIHPKKPQNEAWIVLQGLLMVWLVDCRSGSPTEGMRQRVFLSGEEPAQLEIPAGVAHGYKAGPEGALLIYAMDQQFDLSDPNEGRLSWDYFGSELWDEDRG